MPRNIPAIAAVLGVKPRFLLTGISELGVPVVTPDKITSTLEMMKSGIDLQDDMQFVTPTKTSKTDSYPNSIAMLVNDAAMSIAVTCVYHIHVIILSLSVIASTSG